jgi:hypothetical protein
VAAGIPKEGIRRCIFGLVSTLGAAEGKDHTAHSGRIGVGADVQVSGGQGSQVQDGSVI